MKKHEVRLLTALVIMLAILLTACGTNEAKEAPKGEATWNLIPIDVKISDDRQGWKTYSVQFAVQNSGSVDGVFGNGLGSQATRVEGTVTTTEGYTYSFVVGSRNPTWVPAGFTVTQSLNHSGIFDDSIVGRFEIPENAKIQTIVFPFGEVKLDPVRPVSELGLPTSLPRTEFKDFPVTEEEPGKYRATYSYTLREEQGGVITVLLESLNAGYDVRLSEVKLWNCRVVDQRGYVVDNGGFSMEDNVIPPNGTLKGELSLETSFTKNAKASCHWYHQENHKDIIVDKGMFNLD